MMRRVDKVELVLVTSQGDPNSMPPPMRPGAGAAGAPTAAPTAAPAAGSDPRIRAMIGSIYRDAAANPRAASATSPAPARARMPPTAAARRR
jgi:hypothetical protein